MLLEPRCFTRKCKFFRGVIQTDGTERTEINACDAYPDGIPMDIAYGEDLHLKVRHDQDNNVIFEVKE